METTGKITDYGYKENDEKDKCIARIIAVYRERYEIVCDMGQGYAKLKSSVYFDNSQSIFPTVGDFVFIQWNNMGDSIINETLPRKSFFSRADPDEKRIHEQLIASNFDYVFIMQSLNDNYNMHRMERYLALAWKSGAIPVIILTKCDLVEDYTKYVNEVESIAPGLDVCAISVKNNIGLENLEKYFKPKKTIVFLGSSGVGKSTLVNKLAGKELMQTKEIREDDSRGRHTTTHRELIMLPNGSMVIDTPGMRELGMWDAEEGVDKTFQDVEQFLEKCKFSNCTHTNEPGCAILEAIENGELSEERYLSYNKLKNESKYLQDSVTYLKEKKEKFKQISKMNRNGHKKI